MFEIALLIHVVAGFFCLITGIMAMTFQKKKGKHTIMGEIYHGAFIIVFVTTLLMALLDWDRNVHLFYIGIFSYSLVFFGYLARKKRWENWYITHIVGMLGSYIAIITAFTVVNVSRVPILNEWEPLIFWLLPTIIGTPIIYMVRLRYQKVKESESRHI